MLTRRPATYRVAALPLSYGGKAGIFRWLAARAPGLPLWLAARALGGIRTLTGRLLKPVPLPLGYVRKMVVFGDRGDDQTA